MLQIQNETPEKLCNPMVKSKSKEGRRGLGGNLFSSRSFFIIL